MGRGGVDERREKVRRVEVSAPLRGSSHRHTKVDGGASLAASFWREGRAKCRNSWNARRDQNGQMGCCQGFRFESASEAPDAFGGGRGFERLQLGRFDSSRNAATAIRAGSCAEVSGGEAKTTDIRDSAGHVHLGYGRDGSIQVFKLSAADSGRGKIGRGIPRGETWCASPADGVGTCDSSDSPSCPR